MSYEKLLPYLSFKFKVCLYSAAAAPAPPVKGKGKAAPPPVKGKGKR
jgi:hypothetical protein